MEDNEFGEFAKDDNTKAERVSNQPYDEKLDVEDESQSNTDLSPPHGRIQANASILQMPKTLSAQEDINQQQQQRNQSMGMGGGGGGQEEEGEEERSIGSSGGGGMSGGEGGDRDRDRDIDQQQQQQQQQQYTQSLSNQIPSTSSLSSLSSSSSSTTSSIAIQDSLIPSQQQQQPQPSSFSSSSLSSSSLSTFSPSSPPLFSSSDSSVSSSSSSSSAMSLSSYPFSTSTFSTSSPSLSSSSLASVPSVISSSSVSSTSSISVSTVSSTSTNAFAASSASSSALEEVTMTKTRVKLYDPNEYASLSVSSEIKDLFQHITRYKPKDIELDPRLRPFVPDFIPSVGDLDTFLKVPAPDGKKELLGLTELDEPATLQTDPNVFDLYIQQACKTESKVKDRTVGTIENAEKAPKRVSAWITQILEIHRKQPPPTVHYSKTMPDSDKLAMVWPDTFEETLKHIPLPSSELEMDLSQYVRTVCAILDVPVYDKLTESLHALFTLYSDCKNNAHFT
eukprot:TRINITY_DN136_c0_g2_i1.p1 TRINITY_DN136_c0_g2~~TRINITY_DN136_c0_g2_i1.p1  ORF type:complete len:508 (-),score=216.41 TRINITY_DN136_c0_g2_i1:307-1830(-)